MAVGWTEAAGDEGGSLSASGTIVCDADADVCSTLADDVAERGGAAIELSPPLTGTTPSGDEDEEDSGAPGRDGRPGEDPQQNGAEDSHENQRGNAGENGEENDAEDAEEEAAENGRGNGEQNGSEGTPENGEG